MEWERRSFPGGSSLFHAVGPGVALLLSEPAAFVRLASGDLDRLRSAGRLADVPDALLCRGCQPHRGPQHAGLPVLPLRFSVFRDEPETSGLAVPRTLPRAGVGAGADLPGCLRSIARHEWRAAPDLLGGPT